MLEAGAADAPSWFAWRRRTGLAVGGVAFLAVLLNAFAGPNGPAVAVAWLTDTLLDGGYVALWLAAAGGYGGRLLRRGPDATDADPMLRGVTAVALGVGAIGFAALGLGLCGLLTRGTGWAMLAVGVALLPWRRRPAVDAWLKGRSVAAPWAVPLAGVAGLMVAWASLPPGFLWKPLDPHPYDVVGYHLQVPREWYELGRIVPLPHNAFSYFPAGQEVHSLLAMHLLGGPWAAMYVAQLIPVALTLLTVLAVVGFARPFCGRIAWCAGLLVPAVPWTLMLGSVAYVESGVTLYATLAVAWAVRCRGVRDAAVAGVCLGLAGGTKYTALAMTAAPLLALWPAAARAAGRPALRPWLAMAVACGVVVSPWLVRDAVWTGDPVFPLASQHFARSPFTAEQADRFAAAHAPPAAERSLPARWDAAWHRVFASAQFNPLVVALAVVALASAAWAVTRRRDRDDRERRAAGFLVGMMLVLAFTVWLLATHDEPRFLAPAAPLVPMLLCVTAARFATRPLVRGIFAAACVAAFAFGVVWTLDAAAADTARGRLGLYRVTDVSALLQPEAKDLLDAGGRLALVGDAQAFFYPFPAGRLKYRGVFDVVVPPGTGLADGWLGEPVERLRDQGWAVQVSPGELARLSATYRHLPPPAPPYDDPARPPVLLPPTGPGR